MKTFLKCLLSFFFLIVLINITFSELNDYKVTYTDKLSLNLNSGAVFEVNQDIYKETAFKRFQVVFLSTLPLTMFITYSAVQIYEMSKQKTTSPVMSKSNLQFVIGFSVTSSAVIATKDLIHWKKHQKKKNDGKSASEK